MQDKYLHMELTFDKKPICVHVLKQTLQ